MSRLNWRSRSVVAAGAAAVLVGTGVAALASTTGGSPADAAPAVTSPADPQLATDDRSAELRRSLAEVMGQVDALEASLATPSPSATGGAVDDRGGDRPAGVSDDGPGHDLYDDHGGRGDDDGDDDHGRGDDDHAQVSDDHGDDRGEVEGDDD